MEKFLAELYKLMSRYDASITVVENNESTFDFPPEEVWIRVGDAQVKIANDVGIDAYDLKAYLDAHVMQSASPDENLKDEPNFLYIL